MKPNYKLLTGLSLTTLFLSLFFGVFAALSFFAPNFFSGLLPFQQVRPFHVSAALFWIITAAATGIVIYKSELFDDVKSNSFFMNSFAAIWITAVILALFSYANNEFGGREYWEFPPFINIFILTAWIFLMIEFFNQVFRSKKEKPVYVWMWGTGIVFFLFTFIEQNLWHIQWFRDSFLREMTVQWKSNGSMVGAWNQMIYGTALFLMVRISGDESIAKSWKAYFSYFLGLTNLIFNWGHHIYNVPTIWWVRDVSYLISMSEWILVISIIQGFKKKLEERRKFRHLVPYRFLIASEFWVFLNLLLALLMSIPGINRYTHGTHVTVAHAMGTTIGINSMILLASISYFLNFTITGKKKMPSLFGFSYWSCQFALFIFWIALITAGITKGIQITANPDALFAEVMLKVYPWLKLFMYAGIVVAITLCIIAVILFRRLFNTETIIEKEEQVITPEAG